MGNIQATATDPRFVTASRAFTKKELSDLKALFVSLAAQSQSDGKFISSSVFEAFFGIREALGDRMFDLVTRERRDGMLTFEDLVIAKGTYEKGTREDIEGFIYQLCDVTGDGCLTRLDLKIVVRTMMEAIFTTEGTGSSSNQMDTDIFLNSAAFSKETGDTEISLINLKSWFSLVPSARKFLGNLLMNPDPGRPGFQVPRLRYPETLSSDLLVLKTEHAWHLGGALSQHEIEEWKLLYHSAINGLSFSTFLSNVSNGDGSTVLVVKDKEGYIYGGYASQPWERHSDFYGDMKSFIFGLYPQASVFRPTGANSNIQWCGVNFSSDSIPNGIGFGGQTNHFGLFLSASLEQGHTYTCRTFDSPCLSKTSRIQPEVIECWGIVTKKVLQDGQTEFVKGTVLERFEEDRNMLKLVGLANSSE